VKGMANNRNEAKVTFKAETAQFKQEIQQANRELTELRAELRLNKNIKTRPVK